MNSKRIFDIAFGVAGLLACAPLLSIIAILVWLDSGGPIFFRQERVGMYGRTFRIHKFRTMVEGAHRGSQITVGDDSRITRVGRFLRRYKLDELPQLFDVVRGKMSFVGPRPEVPKYVAHYPPEVREIVLSVRPGITDPASIEFFDEASLLALAPDPEVEYVQHVLPRKLDAYQKYVRTRSMRQDIKAICATFRRMFSRS